jgi:hypothetical protein
MTDTLDLVFPFFATPGRKVARALQNPIVSWSTREEYKTSSVKNSNSIYYDIVDTAFDFKYSVIVGADGKEKSEIVHQMIADKTSERILYFYCPEDVNQFSREFLRFLDYRLTMVSASCLQWMGYPVYEKQLEEPLLTWGVVQKLLLDALANYRICDCYIIIDSADRLVESNPQLFRMLQYFATHCVDSNKLRFVFVSENGLLFKKLIETSSGDRSHRDWGVVDISQLYEQEAMVFLLSKGIPLELAEKFYKSITGGLRSLLTKVVTEFEHGKDFETILQELDGNLEKTLDEIGMEPSHRLFQTLLTDPSAEVTYKAALELLKGPTLPGNAPEKQLAAEKLFDTLLKRNILTLDSYEKYSFPSNHVKEWMKKKNGSVVKPL